MAETDFHSLLSQKRIREGFRAIHAELVNYVRKQIYSDRAYFSKNWRRGEIDQYCKLTRVALEGKEFALSSSSIFRHLFANIVNGKSTGIVLLDEEHPPRFRDWIRQHVIEHLSLPCIVDIDDLCSAFADDLCVGADGFDVCYPLFVANVESQIHRVTADLFSLYHAEHSEPCTGLLWEKGDDLQVLIDIFPSNDGAPQPSVSLSVRAADGARNRLLSTFKPAIYTILKLAHQFYEPLPPHLAEQYEFDYQLVSEESEFIGGLVSAWFEPDSTKDTQFRRMKNALLLAIEAWKLDHSGIALATVVSAIEALLAKKGQDISKTLAENVATLLEPDSISRPNAVKFFRDIYDARSRVMHGDDISTKDDLLYQAKLLLAGVMKALIQRATFMRRMGHSMENPDALLKELGDKKFGPGQPAGVSVSEIRHLWGGSDQPKSEGA